MAGHRWWVALVAASCAPNLSAGPPEARHVPGSFVAGGAVVDPLLNLAWAAESDQRNAWFGTSIASAGDVNGDGFADVVVGAPEYDTVSLAAGKAYLYSGSLVGLEPNAAWMAGSVQSIAHFGSSVAAAGDVNDDGFGDVVVGAEWYDAGSDQEGRAYLYMGSAAGLDTTEAWTAESDQVDAELGCSVSSAGDVNGDGFADVLVGALLYDAGSKDEGRASAYLGSATGLDPIAAWTAESDQREALFGSSVAAAGDVNGDGYGDVVIGAYGYDNGSTDEGEAFVYLGSATGLEATAVWTTEPDKRDAQLGESVASAGDVNGDGYADVVVGAANMGVGGRACVHLGSAAGPEASAVSLVPPDQQDALFGVAVASAGDVNGDGYADVVVGAQWYDHGSTDEGGAFLYLGSATGLATTAAWSAESNVDSALFGDSVSSAGDVNADGFDDLVVGASRFEHPDPEEGRAYLYLGGCSDGAHLDFADDDGDLVADACDVCPGSDDLQDGDADGVSDGCDLCPFVPDPGQDDVDGDGVGDRCVPFALTVGGVSIANGVTVDVDDALPGEAVTVYLASGSPAVGPCPEPEDHAGMCLDLGSGRSQRWTVAADASGHAALVGAALPAGAVAGTTVTLQAAAERGLGAVKSDPLETTIAP